MPDETPYPESPEWGANVIVCSAPSIILHWAHRDPKMQAFIQWLKDEGEIGAVLDRMRELAVVPPETENTRHSWDFALAGYIYAVYAVNRHSFYAIDQYLLAHVKPSFTTEGMIYQLRKLRMAELMEQDRWFSDYHNQLMGALDA